MGKKTKSKGSKVKGDTLPPPPPAAPAASQLVTKRQRSSDDGASKKAAVAASGAAGSSTGTSSSASERRGVRSGGGAGNEDNPANGEDLVFEDPFGDEFEPEDVEALKAEGERDGDDEDDDDDERMADDGGGTAPGATAAAGTGGGMDVVEEEPPQQPEVQTKVWRAGLDELTEGEELEYDSTAYHMYHSLRPEWPCLSFDIMRDSLGTNRSRFPHTVFAVAGTQADRAESNRLQVMKLSDLHRTSKGAAAAAGSDGEEESEEEGPDETDDDPILDHINIPHRGGVNRVRSMPQKPHVVATWSETSDVHVWDLERQVSALAKGAPRSSKIDPAFTFGGHSEASSWEWPDVGGEGG